MTSLFKYYLKYDPSEFGNQVGINFDSNPDDSNLVNQVSGIILFHRHLLLSFDLDSNHF